MTRRSPLPTLAVAALVAVLTCTLPAAPAWAAPGQSRERSEKQGEKPGKGHAGEQKQRAEGKHNKPQQRQRSPQDAAQRARSQYGGQVLKVQPAGGGYQVRLLQDDGRVVTVPIED